MYFCSAMQQDCLAPHPLTHHNNWYECMVAGYEESKKKIIEVGRTDTNKYGLYIKFECKAVEEV